MLLTPLFAESAQAPVTSEAASFQGLTELLIDDFEDGDLKNQIGGESGAWDTDPEDDSANCEPEMITEGGPDGGKKYLRLKYDVDSETENPPQNGYWTKLKNLDATGFDHLEFDVRGVKELGYPADFKVELKKYKDEKRIEKLQGGFVVKELTGEWQKISIALNRMTGIMDFAQPETWKDPTVGRRNLDEFVIVFQARRAARKVGAIDIDNIRFVKTGNPGPTAVDFPPRTKEKTPVKIEGVEFQKFLIARLQGYPKKLVLKKKFPKNRRAFLKEIAKDTWRFFDEIVDRENQLPLDTIQLDKKEVVGPEGWVGDYTNVTNIGLYLMCLVSAHDFGFITRDEAVRRIRLTLGTVEKLEHYSNGFLYNYYDTTTLDRTSYFVSFVDSGWLAAGLYVVKNAFPEELKEQAERLLQSGDFSFFYDPVDQQMFHGYYDHLKVYSDYHYGAFYTEPRAVSFLAIARKEVPTEHWFRMVRTFPENYVWQTQDPKNRFKKKTLGHEYYDGYYEWNGIPFVPSWGGSLFEALMPTVMIDEKRLAPRGLGLNDKRHTRIHIDYALKELAYPVWGMSPSSVPKGGYSEYGVKILGSMGYKPGVVTPHVTFLALEFAPKEAVQNIRKMIELFDLYGEYGFYDAVDPMTGEVAHKYLCLDQGMIFVALNNYLNKGAIRKRFHSDPIVKEVEPLLSEETFFEKLEESGPG